MSTPIGHPMQLPPIINPNFNPDAYPQSKNVFQPMIGTGIGYDISSNPRKYLFQYSTGKYEPSIPSNSIMIPLIQRSVPLSFKFPLEFLEMRDLEYNTKKLKLSRKEFYFIMNSITTFASDTVERSNNTWLRSISVQVQIFIVLSLVCLFLFLVLVSFKILRIFSLCFAFGSIICIIFSVILYIFTKPEYSIAKQDPLAYVSKLALFCAHLNSSLLNDRKLFLYVAPQCCLSLHRHSCSAHPPMSLILSHLHTKIPFPEKIPQPRLMDWEDMLKLARIFRLKSPRHFSRSQLIEVIPKENFCGTCCSLSLFLLWRESRRSRRRLIYVAEHYPGLFILNMLLWESHLEVPQCFPISPGDDAFLDLLTSSGTKELLHWKKERTRRRQEGDWDDGPYSEYSSYSYSYSPSYSSTMDDGIDPMQKNPYAKEDYDASPHIPTYDRRFVR
ncbi:hypothetical protein ADUPG1_008662 [Aduncisulcus paluster]|uniref:Uncharacterized protein n=1 Tax=Aduncisulcus paluster TaxID=2918883 RepID=A0ABQ5KSS9_9EUKA|nr:hypothetical protein ADUPG1_008662 [Aduncisulcus paluster]